MIEIGKNAPDFILTTDGGGTFKMSDHLGKKIVIYFYPKDDTPGCTKQACDFRDSIARLNALDCIVIGISKDSVASHDKFKAAYNLNFPLGSDEDGKVCEAYGVWKEKSFFGKKYFGIERSMFLIDEKGLFAGIWPKVSVLTHIGKLMKILQA
jgi:thioredoxin-dependent peroxiredoxin